ncbi:MAG: type VI secretion system contractile sheath large subunit [Alphaproteobacteria bacterium]|nr:MAG: type VI secretion system contractile sheath large subunit [Alphaproteobacteria bacterium]
MSLSIQKQLRYIRPPRVQITYDVEIGDAIEKKELPFVVGILADLSGARTTDLPSIKERKFVEIDADNFNDVLKSVQPTLNFNVDNMLIDQSKAKTRVQLKINFTLNTIDDFNPNRIVKIIPDLKVLYERRSSLKDLATKIDGNERLEEFLTNLIQKSGDMTALSKEVDDFNKSQKVGKQLTTLLDDIKVLRDPSNPKTCVDMIGAFLDTYDKNFATPMGALMNAIADLDKKLGDQLDLILHHPDFLALEGSWRGLLYLVSKTPSGPHLKLRVLNISKKEIQKDLESAISFDQSKLFKKIYEEEYGTFGGAPYSCLVGDFYFGRSFEDIEILEKLTGLAAAALAPLITASDPSLFDLDSFEHLAIPRDLSKVFESVELAKWNSLRASEDSRYLAMTMPRVMIRNPYSRQSIEVDGLNYEETIDGRDSSKFCWTNCAYILAERITSAFGQFGWTVAVRGVEGGGIVEDLPAYTFKTPDGDTTLKCPTEVAITDRREKELSDLGFISLCHCKGKDFAAFFGGQTAQKPKLYNKDEANSNAALSARLPYILVASRFAHYIKVMMRDKIGSFMARSEVETYLNNWLADYVLLNDEASQSIKAQYPLREARVEVFDIPGKPGSYKSVVYLRPHYQMEELTVSIRLVATLPPPAK